jgi:hypothetical protein
MNQGSYGGLPGPGATTTQSFKEVLASTDLQAKLPGGVLLKSGFGIVAKGRVLGKITASSKFAPYASTTLTVQAAAGATAITVADASAFIAGDTIIIGSEAAKTIQSINYATNVITLTAATAAIQAIGVSVQTNDGRQTAVCILDNDQDTTLSDAGASAFIAGIFDSTKILGLDVAARTALKLCYFV